MDTLERLDKHNILCVKIKEAMIKIGPFYTSVFVCTIHGSLAVVTNVILFSSMNTTVISYAL